MIRDFIYFVICSAVAHSVKSSLLIAFRYLLKPLVRMALKNDVTFYEFNLALKQSYVDVASRQIRAADSQVSAEGIAVITSIGTEEVKEIMNSGANVLAELSAQAQNPLPRVLNAWHTDAQFTGPYGVVRDLEFERTSKSEEIGAPSFTYLASKYCPGVSAKALLDELMRSKCVVDVGSGHYRAVTRSYVPAPLSDESIRLVAQVIHNLCETLEVNLRPESSSGRGRLQRTIYTRKLLSRETLQEFDAFIRRKWSVSADEIDDWLSQASDAAGVQQSFKTGVGFYHYVVNDDDETEFSKNLPVKGDAT